MKMWTNVQCPLKIMPGSAKKYFDIPLCSVVEYTGNVATCDYNGVQNTQWLEVSYRDKTGWVYREFLESLPVDIGNVVTINSETEDKYDAAQYMIIDGVKQYNMCGELCICQIVGDDTETFITKWKEKDPTWYKAVFGKSGKARTTGAYDLKRILNNVYNIETREINEVLYDKVLKRVLVSPRRLEDAIKKYHFILGVKINSYGELTGGGIGHWVNLTQVVSKRINYGIVEIYNPYPNSYQTYSYQELIKSAGSFYGLFVEKENGRN